MMKSVWDLAAVLLVLALFVRHFFERRYWRHRAYDAEKRESKLRYMIYEAAEDANIPAVDHPRFGPRLREIYPEGSNATS